ncbi:MAG: GNAT family N-acetyltransferase, partial [Desulfobacterales bacterium]|nr:GNAT family N-acetyltransferase [Desulfobacterales bacterium]
DEAWFDTHPEIDRTQTGRVADLWMLGVHPDYLGRGIASRLARLSLEQVAQAGFEYAIVECTGAFSQHAMQAAGCNPVYELPYTDLFWNGEAVFRNVPAPHTKWVIYENKLN